MFKFTYHYQYFFKVLLTGCIIILAAGSMVYGAADDAVVKGRIIDMEGNGLPGGNVQVDNTLLGTSTDSDGYFELAIPQKYFMGKDIKLNASYLGYKPSFKVLSLNQGSNTVDFVLEEDVLSTETIVVTGLADQTTKEKIPFALSVIGEDMLSEVPANSPESAIQGKVAGAQVVKGSGKPGQGASVLLRGVTSIDASNGDPNNNNRDPLNIYGRSQDPLYIVDGIILSGSPEDIDGLDIESIEVIKGAAASSIYGSRAANGVVQIKTKRGNNMANDQTRVKVRSEYGVNALGNELNYSRYHKYLTATDSYVDDNGVQVNPGDWINTNGDKVPRIARIIDGGVDDNAFKDHAYTQIIDHNDQVYRDGEFNTNTVTVSRNMENTNFLAAYTNYKDIGIVNLSDGYDRNTFKFNLDHNIRPELQVALSTQYSKSKTDDIDDSGTMRNPLEELSKTEADVDLKAKDANGEYLVQPDPANRTDNPLYYLNNAVLDFERQRILGSLDLRYFPANWFDLEANFSLDRLELDNFEYYKKGFQSSYYVGIDRGQMTQENGTNQAINASVTTGFRRSFGDLNTRLKLRYLYEKYDYKFIQTQGENLTVANITSWQNVEGEIQNQSLQTLSIAEGIYLISSIDYRDRYITDFLIRRDGSSLFGSDQRYHNYYRFSAAWRLSEESFWPVKNYLNEFKLHYSLGTAGSRPIFSAQYETFNVLAGIVSKDQLGNKDLKPEYATENEIGLSSVVLDRFSLDVNYSNTVVEDQILLVPQVGYKGFSSRWENAGTVESKSFEATLEGLAIRTENQSLSFGFTFDRSRSKITKLNIPPYQYGFGQEGAQFYVKEGEEIGTIFGRKWAKNIGDLPENLQPYSDLFQKNDDGYIVYVGDGNTWRDGISKSLWNTNYDVDGDGRNDVSWGQPIGMENESGNNYFRLGRTTPDFNLGFNTTYKWKNISLYMLWNAQIGGIVYNLNKQWMYTTETHADMDQAGKSDEEKKPVGYYDNFTGGLLADEVFAEDGTFYKLRELAIAYTFNRRQLQSVFGNLFNRISLKLVGRNLLTFTDYDGYDPEVGISGNSSGSSVIGRIDDDVTYPHYRTYSFSVELEF